MNAVQLVPPPPQLVPDLRASIDRALASLSPTQQGALVLVGTKVGDRVVFNAAVVARINDSWAVQSYVAKTWGGSLDGGITVVKTW